MPIFTVPGTDLFVALCGLVGLAVGFGLRVGKKGRSTLILLYGLGVFIAALVVLAYVQVRMEDVALGFRMDVVAFGVLAAFLGYLASVLAVALAKLFRILASLLGQGFYLFVGSLDKLCCRATACLSSLSKAPSGGLHAQGRGAQGGAGAAGNADAGHSQDRAMVLDMLREGKISGDQASELLAAIGPSAVPADRLPLTTAVVASVAGAVLVVIGFMLPWAYVRLGGPMAEVAEMFGRGLLPFSGMGGKPQIARLYLSGQHVGYVGWIVLVAGVLPAFFVCIPALDKHLRQGVLGIVIGSIGGAFVLSMLVRSPLGIGLWVAGAGFALQLSSAVRQAALGGVGGRG